MRIGIKVMSWWNSADAISFASTTSQVALAILGIIVLILGFRSSQLRDRQQQLTKLELEQLKIKTAPRVITENQKKSIIDYLKTARKRPVRVIVLSNSQEVMAYAKDIRSCLNESGFIDPSHSAPEQIIGIAVHTDKNDSFVIAYHSEAEVYKDFNKENDYHNILNAFRMLGISIGTVISPDIVQLGEIALMISDR
jgi:hypothetical protein